MHKYLILIVVLLLALVPLAVLAQDDGDNECLDGGLLDRADGNGCASDWAWTCGWYLDNWLDNGGWFNDDNFFPDWCAPQSLLPPKPEVEEPEAVSSGGNPLIGCVYAGFFSPDHFWISFGYQQFVPPTAYFYTNADCTVPSTSEVILYWVYALGGLDEAKALCAALGGDTPYGIYGDNTYPCGS